MVRDESGMASTRYELAAAAAAVAAAAAAAPVAQLAALHIIVQRDACLSLSSQQRPELARRRCFSPARALQEAPGAMRCCNECLLCPNAGG